MTTDTLARKKRYSRIRSNKAAHWTPKRPLPSGQKPPTRRRRTARKQSETSAFLSPPGLHKADANPGVKARLNSGVKPEAGSRRTNDRLSLRRSAVKVLPNRGLRTGTAFPSKGPPRTPGRPPPFSPPRLMGRSAPPAQPGGACGARVGLAEKPQQGAASRRSGGAWRRRRGCGRRLCQVRARSRARATRRSRGGRRR
jgi:hypothetical protein